ncbi:cytochrome P450 26B1-like isoform X2 [Lates japonicus]|uniref:Cytochrome P450 26B1-like isoform X2 n=1 Tax=Lates japonicus TaxID=270547 RepID=A0AAD3NIM3_LATJO|nr:cytochrome P450 26B1-like isoform X2 [Lates japonicus]
MDGQGRPEGGRDDISAASLPSQSPHSPPACCLHPPTPLPCCYGSSTIPPLRRHCLSWSVCLFFSHSLFVSGCLHFPPLIHCRAALFPLVTMEMRSTCKYLSTLAKAVQ